MTVLWDKWDQLYRASDPCEATAIGVLTENDFLLPQSGEALDLACGIGANAIYLAQNGLDVTALDQSSVAVEKLKKFAASHLLKIDAQTIKIDSMNFPKSRYDVIIVSRFLDRTLRDAIIGALKPDGLLFYQTYTQEKHVGIGPSNRNYLLAANELLHMFSRLRVVFYRENALIGNSEQGLRNEAQFIGRNNTVVKS